MCRRDKKVDILISGSGGQGIMSLGKIIAKIALLEDKFITWFPSYGAEMRGGTAHCFVRISDKEIASPLVERPHIAIIMNQPSLDKFFSCILEGGILIANKDLIFKIPQRKDVNIYLFPFTSISLKLDNPKGANIVALGVLWSIKKDLFKEENIKKILREYFQDKDILNKNLQAFYKGVELVKG